MRRTPPVLFLSVLTPALLALPVTTPATPAPRPVAPAVQSIDLEPVAGEVAGESPGEARAAAVPEGRRTVVLTEERDTARFDLVGVTWQDDPGTGPVSVSVRTRTEGRWTGWTDLGGRTDEQPDTTTAESQGARVGTAPAWVGTSDGVQVRVDVLAGEPPRDVDVQLVDPGSSPADAGLGATPLSTASAAAARPPVRSRAAWGADESIRRGSPSYASTVQAATLHHTASSNSYSAAQVPALLRGFYAYHVKSLGWSDIGYNVLVDKFGTAWEGRAGGLDRPVIGAHAGGFNTGTFGVSMIGTYSTATPPAAMTATVSKLVGWKLGLHQRDPGGTVKLTSGGSTRYAAGKEVTLPVVFGHREVSTTDCPGARGMAALPGIRAAATALIGAAVVEPAISQSSTAVRVTAGVLGTSSWRLTATEVASGVVVRAWTGTGRVDVSWDRRSAAGTLVTTGSYRLLLTVPGDPAVEPWSATVTVTGSTSSVQSQAGGPLSATGVASATELVSRTSAGAATWRQVAAGRLMSSFSLGGTVLGAPAVAPRAGSAVEVVARGTDDGLWSVLRGDDGVWRSWQQVPGSRGATTRPALAGRGTGRVDVVVRGPSGSLRHGWSEAPGVWGWEDLGGAVLPGAGPATAWTAGGRFEVLVVGTDRQVWRRSYTVAGGWTAWQGLGGTTSDDLAATASGEQLVAVARGTDRGGWARSVSATGAGSWTGLGGVMVAGPAAATASAGAVEVVVPGTDGALHRRSRTSAWSGWQRLG